MSRKKNCETNPITSQESWWFPRLKGKRTQPLTPIGRPAGPAVRPSQGMSILDRRKIASLVGVAPIAKDGGRKRGQRVVAEGRGAVRRVLYMAALIATMRKMLVTLNAIARADQPWCDPALQPAA
jgi:Transposase IS116/IS110/IS902 family